MTSAKEEILGRVRSALRDVPADETPADSPVEWVYHRSVEVGNIIDTFEQRVVDYKAAVVRSPKAKLAAALTTAARDLGVTSAVVPAGLAQAWRDGLAAAGVEVVEDNPGHRFSHSELNDTGAVVTAAACGVALTGTIVLDHSADQGRRALSLVPDVHICVVMADQVVSGVPEAVERVKPAVLAGQPLTWISGGSATSDIELSRVEGVHGPRSLYVIIAE